METNAKHIAFGLFLTALAVAQAHGQTPVPSDGPAPNVATAAPVGPGRPDGPGKHRGHGLNRHLADGQPGRRKAAGGRTRGLTSLTTVTGTVGQLTGNDDAIFDGFVLNGGSGAMPTTVKFAPHLGQQIQKAVKPGSAVSVTGFSETNPRGETTFRLTSLTAGKTTVLDGPPAAPARLAETPTLVTATGKVADYRLDRSGRVNGLVLDNQTIVRVPPHVAYQLTNLATKGSTITVQGYPRTLREGQVQLEKTNILRASVLTINGQQYLVR